MLTIYESQFERRLKTALSDMLARKIGALVDGNARDYAEYRQHAGYLAALKDFKAVIEEISGDLNKEEKD